MIRKAKIVGTLGPSSNSPEMIKQLINAGLNVARVNMSHGTHEAHAQTIKNIRMVSLELKQEVAILLDLQGPKIRVDKLAEPLTLLADEEWVIGPTALKSKYAKHPRYIPTIYEKLVEDSKPGCRILFDDGLIRAQAIEKDGEVLRIKIIIGGILKSNKGINLPDVKVSAPSMTEKDEQDLMFGLSQGIDYVALSFVRSKEDVLQLKYRLHKLKLEIPIVAKIEKPEAIDCIDEIIKAADVIMVARGDMGVELGNHLVPSVQKKIINKCNYAGVPVITATQMLESMIENSTPTRAEASDVANAIWDGTDAVMLSGETASGKYPVAAVTMMSNIIIEAEKTPKDRPLMRHMDLSGVDAALQVSASLISEKVFAKWVMAITQTGSSCRQMARFRPSAKVLGVTNDLKVVRRMGMYWGITPYFYQGDLDDFQILENKVIADIRSMDQLYNGDKIVISRGDGKIFHQAWTNSVRVEIIKDQPKVLGGQESLSQVEFSKGKILLDNAVCASCHKCVRVCPHDIWQVTTSADRTTFINVNAVEDCTLDMQCVQVCPTGAIEIIAKPT